MVTKQQAMTCDEFHLGECTRHIGKRGGVKEYSQRLRRNGHTRTWATRPNDWRVPVKYGQYGYGTVDDSNCGDYHTVGDCPLNDPEFATEDYRYVYGVFAGEQWVMLESKSQAIRLAKRHPDGMVIRNRHSRRGETWDSITFAKVGEVIFSVEED